MTALRYKFRPGVVGCILLGAYVLMLAPGALATSIDGIRLWQAPDHTRLVFDLSAPVEHKIFALQNPDRLVIDVAKSTLRTKSSQLDFSTTPIKGLRSAARKGGELRLVLDLKAPVKPRSFMLRRNEQYGDRLVLDLYEKATTTAKTVADVVVDASELRDVVVAIDAGHGGEDPGAIGANKVYEKRIALSISRELKKLVDREPGYRTVLVRTGDYYIPLSKRTSIARKTRADIFISIHADAFKNTSAHGASVYTLSRRGASSEAARYIAQRENRADLIGGVGSVSLNDKDAMLASVLLDLSMTATLDSSLEIGSKVLKEVGKITRLHKKQVEQAGFVVLKSPDVPSILVETGFISNPKEARRLNQRGHQRALARAIFSGVQAYFEYTPPLGSLLAARQKKSTSVHVISKGDTLSDLAQRYRVSVKAIQRNNKLKSTRIRIGQRLEIPAS